ncbi:MAG: hypothetical protein A2Z20_08940 [Bdellovibrionales bacterium RBG_16_40_8]|nr:MAG: hypothetical protein A2Z20_08940 [Bdellovibrionales bacterium RBG_16_40_8]
MIWRNLVKIFFCICLGVSISETLLSADQPSSISINWYKPEVYISNKPGYSRVKLSGQTEPSSELKISTNKIPFIDKDGNPQILPSEGVMKSEATYSDERGQFELNLELPMASVQLPIEVISPGGQSKRYQLYLEVTKDAYLKNQKNITNSPYSRRKWGVWGGFGINDLKYEQKSADTSTSLSYESFSGPTLYGKIARSINKEFSVQITANRAPGEVKSSTSTQVSQGTYYWSFLTGELTYFHKNWKINHQKKISEFGVQLGTQYHMVPFLMRASTSDPSIYSVEENDVFLATIGGTWILHYNRYWYFETFMRYQIPYLSGSLYDVSYKFAFDGSAGIIYRLKTNWRLGAFWYGQWHEYNFSHHKDKYFEANGGGGPYIGGEQSLFFSNIEARIGYEFD